MPAVCKFFLKGYCRYGNSCRFEHPGENDYSGPSSSSYANTHPASNFSFKSALSSIAPSATFSQTPIKASQSDGFSFARALESTTGQKIFGGHDVDMLDGLAFANRDQNIGGIFALREQQQQQSYQFPQQSGSFFSNPYHSQQQQNLLPAQQIFQQQSLFGQTSTFGFPNSSTIKQETSTTKNPLFSDPQELTEAELKTFQEDRFEFRKIPIRPPPQAACR